MNSTVSLLALVLAAGSVSSVARGQSWANPVDGSWFTPANWTPQVVPTGNTAMATLGLAGLYTVTTSNNTLMGVSITNPQATLAINGTQNLVLDGAVNNTLNGTIRVNTAGAYQGTSLSILQPGTSFSGTGTLRLNASGSDGSTTQMTARLFGSATGTLTMNAGTSLAGFGFVGPLATTNNGTFNADVSGRPLRIDGAVHQNNALYTASNGGYILLNGLTVNQSVSGSMAPGVDSSIVLSNSTVNGGSIVSSVTGRVIHSGSSTSTLSGVTIAGGMDLNGTSNTYIGAPGVALSGGATVLVNTAGAYQGTHLRTNFADTPFSGNGTVRLNASGSDGSTTQLTAAIDDGGSGLGSFVFGPAVSLAGFGIVNGIPTVNNGTFNADVTGRYLRVEGNTHGNNGLYTATNGGTLLLANVTLTQGPGAGISAVGASGDTNSSVQLFNTSITNGSVASNGAAHVFALGGGSVTLSGVALFGGIDVNGTCTMYIDSPGITLNGGATILVNTAAAYQGTHIRTGDADTAINGNGTVRLNASGSDGATTQLTAEISEDGGDAGGSFVFAPGITLAGFGIVNNIPTTSNGVFIADVSGRPLRIESSTHQNNNLYSSSNGGVLWLTGTTVNQSSTARVLAGDGSGVDLTNTRINGGTVGSVGGGTGNTVVNGTVTLDGVSVSRQMNINGTSTLVSTENGITLTNNAVVTVNTAAAYQGTRLRAGGAVTPIGGTGTIHLNASGSDGATVQGTADLDKTGAGSFVFGAGITVDGFGRISDCPTVNNGVVNASTAGRPLRIDGNTHQNNNAYRSSNGGTLVLVGATVSQNGPASFDAGDASAVSLNSSSVTGGLFTATGSGRFAIGASSTLNGVTSSAPLDVNGNTTLTVGAAGITNNNVILVNTGAAYQGTRVHAGAPTSAINGAGEVRLNRSGSDGTAVQGTADIGASAAGNTFSFGSGQTLSGSGRITANVSMSGVVSPGVGVGDVDFIRNESGATLGFTNSGRLRIETASVSSYDRLVNAGTVNLDGTLIVDSAFNAVPGTVFDVITGGTINGQFDTVLSSGLSAPKRFGARYDIPGKVRVTVLCGPADIAGQGADGNGDGVLNNNDFIVYIDRFFANDPRADVGSTGGVPGSDGAFDNNDFIVFIDLFFAGCF